LALKKLLVGAPACNCRRAGEGELLFAIIHCGSILSGLAGGGNRQVLASFWRFCPIARSVSGRQRPNGQAMTEQWRGFGVGRARNPSVQGRRSGFCSGSKGDLTQFRTT